MNEYYKDMHYSFRFMQERLGEDKQDVIDYLSKRIKYCKQRIKKYE